MENPQIGLKVEAHVRTTPEINHQFLPGEVGCVLDWEIRDTKTGKLISSEIRKAESFTRQFFDLLLIKIVGSTNMAQVQVKDIAAVLQNIANTPQMFATNAGTGIVNFGIIVGTGNTAPTINDYVIGTIIPNDAGGHGAGTIQYGAVTYGLPSSDATTSQFTITRNFANATAGAITVNEIALYVKSIIDAAYLRFDSAQIPGYFMTIRDVIAGGISVGIGQTLTVNYRPQCVI